MTLISARPAATFPAAEHHRLWPVPNYTVWWHWQRQMCVNNLPWVGTWNLNGQGRSAISCSLVQRINHCTTILIIILSLVILFNSKCHWCTLQTVLDFYLIVISFCRSDESISRSVFFGWFCSNWFVACSSWTLHYLFVKFALIGGDSLPIILICPFFLSKQILLIKFIWEISFCSVRSNQIKWKTHLLSAVFHRRIRGI